MTAFKTPVCPSLTVVIPCYRGEQWIDACLRSVASERAEGLNVLVVDSSTDSASRDIARSYSDRLNIRVLERSDLRSWQAKTNHAVEAAETSHICWLGVDDLWLPGRASAIREWVSAAPDARLHLGPCAIIDKNGRKLGIWRCPFPGNTELSSSLVTERLLVQNFVAAPSPVFRRDDWLRCGGLDESLWYTADWDLWLKLTALGSVFYHDNVTVAFRVHAGSQTTAGSRDTKAFSHQMQLVLERHLLRLGRVSKGVESAARASISVNTALAAADAGDFGALIRAAAAVARLGPAGIRRYLRDSRIVERAVPRIRAKLSGAYP